MSNALPISDEEWFDLQFDPAKAKSKYGISLAPLPSDDAQMTFTGMAGRDNLRQGFKFYLRARNAGRITETDNPRIMDFGAGWGRIARFWLRDTRPENIVAADTMPFAVRCLREAGSAFRIVQNNPAPPIPGFKETFHLIYAFSVFSHLSESYSLAWIDYLLGRLQPGGHFVLTTRGERFMNDIGSIKAQTEEAIDASVGSGVADYLRFIRRTFPGPDVMRQKYADGEFQFYPMEHKELPEDCTGETIIPRRFFETQYKDYFQSLEEDADSNQAIVVLKRPG